VIAAAKRRAASCVSGTTSFRSRLAECRDLYELATGADRARGSIRVTIFGCVRAAGHGGSEHWVHACREGSLQHNLARLYKITEFLDR